MYVDIPRLCFINIRREKIEGNIDYVRKALKVIKKNNSSDYKVVCENINKIVFGRCFTLSKTGPNGYPLDVNGCYFNGSKMLYINIFNQNSANSVENITNTIIKYSYESQKFWRGKTN